MSIHITVKKFSPTKKPLLPTVNCEFLTYMTKVTSVMTKILTLSYKNTNIAFSGQNPQKSFSEEKRDRNANGMTLTLIQPFILVALSVLGGPNFLVHAY